MPTVSALVGPVALGQRLWCTWAKRRSRVPLVVVGGVVEKWFQKWVQALVAALPDPVLTDEEIMDKIELGSSPSGGTHDRRTIASGIATTSDNEHGSTTASP